jgi:hypothetical protein
MPLASGDAAATLALDIGYKVGRPAVPARCAADVSQGPTGPGPLKEPGPGILGPGILGPGILGPGLLAPRL